MAVSANRLELLQIADAVAREKSIDRMIVVNGQISRIRITTRRAIFTQKSGEVR